eukprot:sb/3469187/
MCGGRGHANTLKKERFIIGAERDRERERERERKREREREKTETETENGGTLQEFVKVKDKLKGLSGQCSDHSSRYEYSRYLQNMLKLLHRSDTSSFLLGGTKKPKDYEQIKEEERKRREEEERKRREELMDSIQEFRVGEIKTLADVPRNRYQRPPDMNFGPKKLRRARFHLCEKWPKLNLADGNRLPIFLYLGHRVFRRTFEYKIDVPSLTNRQIYRRKVTNTRRDYEIRPGFTF